MTLILRKVSELSDAWTFSYSVIETQDDGIIIEYEDSYTTVDDSGNTIIESNELVGVETSWRDVTNVMYFNFKIGDTIYSWDGVNNTVKVGITSTGDVGIVAYHQFKINNSKCNLRRIITPKFTPIKLSSGKFTINGVCRPEQTFIDARTGEIHTMADITLIRGDIEKELTYDQIDTEMI